jgi:hypothetical protein
MSFDLLHATPPCKLGISLVLKRWHGGPVPPSFDEDQGSSPVDGEYLAVLGHPCERVVSIHDPRGIAQHPARRLTKAEAHRGDAFGGAGQICGELRFPVKPVGDMIEDLQVLGEHAYDGFEVLVGERVSELLRQAWISCTLIVAPPCPFSL